jgi:hypothetical protein
MSQPFAADITLPRRGEGRVEGRTDAICDHMVGPFGRGSFDHSAEICGDDHRLRALSHQLVYFQD